MDDTYEKIHLVLKDKSALREGRITIIGDNGSRRETVIPLTQRLAIHTVIGSKDPKPPDAA